ncbi:MAG: TetR/AcrR family transcriptional regulator [Acidimicrobiales bacterium]|nr:TetR/AcrR family transcriptional regulator [Acidimicrobiales bacterium]
MAAVAKSRVRMDPDERRALLLKSATEVFAIRGYASSGLSEIADIGSVSKTLLYHYFPDGRPQLYAAVMDDVLAKLVSRLRNISSLPLKPSARLDRLVEEFVSFFDDHREAFRLLFREPWGSGEEVLIIRAIAAQIQIANELIHPLTDQGAKADLVLIATSGAMGTLLHTTELWLSGQIDKTTVIKSTATMLRHGMCGLGVIRED